MGYITAALSAICFVLCYLLWITTRTNVTLIGLIEDIHQLRDKCSDVDTATAILYDGITAKVKTLDQRITPLEKAASGSIVNLDDRISVLEKDHLLAIALAGIQKTAIVNKTVV